MGKLLTTEQFKTRAIEKHGNKYDYSLVNYINRRTEITIICEHGHIFQQLPQSHIKCNDCCTVCFNGGKSNTADFINKSNKIHNFKYDYSKVDYIKAKSKVIIICPSHGEFLQNPNDHLTGYGCIICSGRYSKKDEFEHNANLVHNYKYDYSKVDYKNNKTKVIITCPLHGDFKQKPDAHIQGHICSKCSEESKESKGVKIISDHLNEINIDYVKEYRFEDCVYKRELPFDFYIPEYNMCIEFDGLQHFKPIDFWGGIEGFKLNQIRDNIKNEYCKDNNIRLLRINDKNICDFQKLFKNQYYQCDKLNKPEHF